MPFQTLEANLPARKRIIVLLVSVIAAGLAGNVVAQEPDTPPDTLIRLQRTSCFGTCPVYTVTIDARGVVGYEGQRFVRVVGRRIDQVDPSTVAALLAQSRRIGFFQMKDAYRGLENPDGTVSMVTDLPTKLVTVTANGVTKRVEDYVGAPDVLADFERQIDEAAGTKRWIFLDELALDELVHSGWVASAHEGAALLQKAIERDDVPIARRLIELGAFLGGPAEHRLPPLVSARSGAMVDLLVKAGADPNERPLGGIAGRTPLMMAVYRDASVTESLLRAGAHVDDLADGRTALWYAACGGHWRAVAALLGGGANPRGAIEISAIECARQGRESEAKQRRTALDRGRPTVEDFDRVLTLLETAQTRARQ